MPFVESDSAPAWRDVLAIGAAVLAATGASACDGARRFASGSQEGDAYLVGAGKYYGDGDTEVGPAPSWDTIAGGFAGKPMRADGAASTSTPAQPLPCGGSTPKPDNTCCPVGTAWSPAAVDCVSVAIAECPDPATCKPRWCGDWRDLSGKACVAGGPGCHIAPRACAAAELTGSACPAGEWPSTKAQPAGCVPAGTDVQLPGGAIVAADGKVAPLPPTAQLVPLALVAADVPLANATAPAWCFPSADPATACPAYGGSCAVGTVVDPVAKASCVPLDSTLPPWCPQGFVADGATVPACAPDPSECGSDPWGGAPDNGKTVFVDKAYAGQAKPEGSKAAPYTAIGDALAKVKTNAALGTIALATGSYVLPPGPTVVPPGIVLRGRCAASTVLLGSVAGAGAWVEVGGAVERLSVVDGQIPVILLAQGTLSRVRVQGGTYAGIRMLGGAINHVVVQGLGRGILVDGKGGAGALFGVRISDAKDRGVVVAGGFSASLNKVVVTGTGPAADGKGGYGVLVAEGAKAQIVGLRAHGNATAGVAAFDPGSHLQLSYASIAATVAAAADKSAGHGVLVSGGAKASMHHAILVANRAIGALAYGAGSVLQGANWTVKDTQPQAADDALGDGARVQNGASLSVTGLWAVGNRNYGALCTGAASKLTIAAGLVIGTLAQAKDGQRGEGLRIESGCAAKLGELRLDGNRSVGLVVAGEGSTVDGGVLVVSNMQPQTSDGQKGFGVQVVEGGRLTAASLHVHGARTAAAWVSDAKTTVQLGGFKALHTLPQSDGFGGRGMHVAGGAQVLVSGAVILLDNRDYAVLAEGAATQLTLGDGKNPVIVAQTSPRPDGWAGQGVHARKGAQVMLLHAHVTAAREAGVVATGTGTRIDAKGLWVTAVEPRAKDGTLGRGVVVEDKATFAADGLVVAGCGDAGVFSHDGTLQGQDWTIGHLAGAKGLRGRGLVVQGGASAHLTRLRIAAAREVGIAAAASAKAATVLDLRDVVVDATLPESVTLEAGRALDLSAGATATVIGLVVAGNTGSGLVVAGPGARLHAGNVAVFDTKGDAATGRRGRGIDVGEGGALVLAGARVIGNREAGLLVHAGKALLGGVWLAGGHGDASGAAGWGAAVQAGGTIDAFGVRAVGNRGAALAVIGQASRAQVVRASLHDTAVALIVAPGGAVVGEAADGVHVAAGGQLELAQAVVSKAKRAAVVVDAASAKLVETRIAGNGFGWSVQNGGKVSTQLTAVSDNDQNVWTGAALPTLGPLDPVFGRPTMEPLTY
ncbi:MAG: hypothetical protein FJ100_06945 [Deltaproteobacteria bacterium]|nr:hypothetical protein [Deltaproteobacteria bacterium]